MRLFIFFIGKPKDAHTNAVAEDFVKRASRYSPAEMREIRPDRFRPWEEKPSARQIYLDPAGKPMDSAAFAALLGRSEMEGRDLVFVIGGHDGLPEGWREHAERLLSLSPMTFPHELARAVLAEQIYRGFATLRGHPYPR